MKYVCNNIEKEYPRTLKQLYKEGALFSLKHNDLKDAFEFIEKYVEETKKTKILLKKKNTEDYLILDYTTRFSANYRKKIKQKLENIFLGVKTTCGHLTLTIENLTFDELITKRKKISETLHLFFKELQRKYGKIKRIVTREVTRTKDNKFHLHFHCLIPYWAFIKKEKLKDIREIWSNVAKTQGIKAEYLNYKYLENKEALLYYILKYITKDFLFVNLTSVCLTLLNMRSYTMNFEEKKDLEINESVFEFCGLLNDEEAESFLKTHNVLNKAIVEKSIKRKKETEIKNKDPPYPPPIKVETIYIRKEEV